MIGQKFGRWEVVAETDKRVTRRQLKAWVCKCECGTTKHVAEDQLKRGKSKSCGCSNPWRTWYGPKEMER